MATSPSKVDVLKEIIRGIQHDLTLYDALYRLLLKQQHCYLSFDDSSMQEITEKLHPMIDTLHKNAKHRTALLGYLGLKQSKEGMKKLINTLPGNLKIQTATQWKELEVMVQSCHQQNQLNGQLSVSYREMLRLFGHENANDYASTKLMEL
ncbi:hypothetical protein CSW98_09350 [Vibrio sp. HA2012]|uniref:flagellar export chaperone FlgN n=1 Tax=Vibrio sp. HA2012 TaxID=1971595 RepID=UPI000C2C86CF|nr:flagellar export chaperone FlgN [Vibrio sp. HA2012]PJC86408.1 hypothetical protein CSW98_09350 [Vibrio sp. HA2012]